MHLLASVNAGFAACPNGWVELYIRGSSTRAEWFSSFEGDGSNTTGANITLDAYGSAEIYVNQLVDVVVKQSDGTLYREYTDGYSSPNVEVRSLSFTGIDYDTAASAPGNPTTLQAVLDKWLVSSGAPDFEVLFRGSTHSLEDLAGALGGLVINVQSPAYGAVGDGTTDDTTAILNALADAVLTLNGNVGITVFFPKGNYVISSVITWDYRVNIIMVPGSTLTNNSATNAVTLKLTSANSTNYETIFFGLGFKAAQSNTGVSLSLEANQRLTLINCSFGGSALDTGTQINIAATVSKLTLQRCRFSINGASQVAIGRTSGTVTAMKLIDCEFVAPATYNTGMVVLNSFSASCELEVRGCKFDFATNSTTTGGSNMGIRCPSGDVVVSNCRWSGAPTYAVFEDFSGPLIAYGNFYDSAVNRFSLPTMANGTYIELDKYELNSANVTAFTLGTYTEFTEFLSNTTAPTITLPSGLYLGQKRHILYHNASGGNWAAVAYVGIGAPGRVTALPATAITAGSWMMDSFIWHSGGWIKWQEA